MQTSSCTICRVCVQQGTTQGRGKVWTKKQQIGIFQCLIGMGINLIYFSLDKRMQAIQGPGISCNYLMQHRLILHTNFIQIAFQLRHWDLLRKEGSQAASHQQEVRRGLQTAAAQEPQGWAPTKGHCHQWRRDWSRLRPLQIKHCWQFGNRNNSSE